MSVAHSRGQTCCGECAHTSKRGASAHPVQTCIHMRELQYLRRIAFLSTLLSLHQNNIDYRTPFVLTGVVSTVGSGISPPLPYLVTHLISVEFYD